MITIEQRLASQINELSQATSDHMGQIKAVFDAIGKLATAEPVLAANLASVGSYLVDLAEGDFDTIGMQLESVGKEIH